MRKVLILFTILSVLACKEKSSEPLVGLQFKDHKKIAQLVHFEKKSDTTFIYKDDFEPTLGLLHLKKKEEDLVIFARVWNDSGNTRNYEVLDTLAFSNLDEQENLTIGNCEFDLKNQNNGNIIALVETTDSKNMFVTAIKDAWIANPNSEKIEQLKSNRKVECFNEWYDGEERKITWDVR